MAHLDGTAFVEADCATITAAALGDQLADVPFDGADTFVVETENGDLYAVGNPVEDDAEGVTFDFTQPCDVNFVCP